MRVSRVYWVKHTGENDLDIPMFLRPASETAMYTMFPCGFGLVRIYPSNIPDG